MTSSNWLAGSRQNAVEWIDDNSDDDLFNDFPGTIAETPPRNSPYFTQPTQIVHRTTLQSTLPQRSSPIVEVPASSPFQSRAQPATRPQAVGRIASLMAPAGTVFRPPPQARPAVTSIPKKDVILLSDDEVSRPTHLDDDSSDDGRPMRGDIRPSTFAAPKRAVNAPLLAKAKLEQTKLFSVQSSRASSKEPQMTVHARGAARLQHLADKLYKSTSGRYAQSQCREALLKTQLDIAKARDYLRDAFDSSPVSQIKSYAYLPPESQGSSSGVSSPTSVDSFASIPQKRQNESISSAPSFVSRDVSSQSPTPKRPAQRRLVQGRRPRPGHVASSSPLPQSAVAPSSFRHAIPLSDDDDDAAAPSEDELSQEPLPVATRSRLLELLNSTTTQQLIAIATTTEQIAQLIIDHRPYHSIADVHRVSMPRRQQGRGKAKSARIEVGEDVVRAIQAFLRALEGIDRVVEICERTASTVRKAVTSWDVDSQGKSRTASQSGSRSPGTPVSLDSQLHTSRALPYPLEPPAMRGHCKMKEYQLYGLNWMRLLYKSHFGGILADDMGLGKTCQVISLMASLVDDYETDKVNKEVPWPNLIIVPPSTLANWAAEFERFAPDVTVTMYSGSQAERDSIAYGIIEDPDAHHVVLTSYTQLGRNEDIQWMREIQPNIAVFDEGHKLKNPGAKAYKDLLRIHANWRLLLTGTPVQNNLMEMVALLNFVHPDLFNAHFEDLGELFKQKVSLKDVSNGALLYSERVSKARVILEPFILQRRKEQVLGDIPRKTCRVQQCELGEVQRAIYQEYESSFWKGSEAKTRRKEARSNDQNNIWLQLRKSAIHPLLFRRAFTDAKIEKMARILMDKVPQEDLRQPDLGKLVEELQACSDFQLHLWCRDYPCIKRFDLADGAWLESAKVEELLKLLERYQANGDRALVFTRYAQVVEILAECFVSADVKYLSLQGNTEVSERQGLINEFNEDSSITAFVLTTAAGGMGINLTAANKVIIFDQSDNPMDDIQAENRAHRLGQQREVEVVRLLSKGTVEELVYAACQKKIELANRVTGQIGDDTDIEMTSAQLEAEVRGLMEKAGGEITPPSSD